MFTLPEKRQNKLKIIIFISIKEFLITAIILFFKGMIGATLNVTIRRLYASDSDV